MVETLTQPNRSKVGLMITPPPMPQMAPAVLASRLTRKKISVILSPFHTLSVKGAVSSPCSSLGTAGGVIQVPKALLNAYFGKICQNSI